MTDIRPKSLPDGFRVVGPIYGSVWLADGTIIHTVDHRNGVVDVKVEHPDGSVMEAIEVR